MRGATINLATGCPSELISIHTPHAGSDFFHSTGRCGGSHFNPHSPCGERLLIAVITCRASYFNPHSPCGERLPHAARACVVSLFQSTLPMRGATVFHIFVLLWLAISIHTPHAGSDFGVTVSSGISPNFNPHSPCGERHRPIYKGNHHQYFNPHSPCGERL